MPSSIYETDWQFRYVTEMENGGIVCADYLASGPAALYGARRRSLRVGWLIGCPVGLACEGGAGGASLRQVLLTVLPACVTIAGMVARRKTVAIEVKPAELARLRLPPAVDARLQTLLDRQERGEKLAAAELREANGLVELAEMLALLKMRAATH